MGWLDKVKSKKETVIPEIFKDKSEEDILKMLQESAADKEKIKTLETKVTEQDTTVGKIQTEFEAVKTRLAAAEAKPRTAKTEDGSEEATPDNIMTDPKKVLDAHTAPTTALAINASAQTARMLAQQQLNNQDLASGGKTMDGRLFAAWSNEIDEQSKRYQAIQIITPNAWIGIYLYLKGVHADELRDPEVRKKKYNFLEPSTIGTLPTPDGKPKDGAESLTDQEKHVADRMGVSYENYAKRKKAMVMVNA